MTLHEKEVYRTIDRPLHIYYVVDGSLVITSFSFYLQFTIQLHFKTWI